MKLDLDFAYAQARIQSRFAALPPQAEWQRLAASRSLASFLEEARAGPLREWVKGFSNQSDVHDLEAGVRSLFRENLEAVAGWVPTPWRKAVSWIRWLALLPLLAHLQAVGTVPAWVARDPALRVLLSAEGELDMGCLEEAGATCLLEPEEDLVAVWLAQWNHRWPGCSREASRDLDALADLLVAHADALGRGSPDAAWRLRGELRDKLRLRFHRQALQPAVPFIYLALAALDLERLRAALVGRVLFSAQDEQAGPEASERVAA